jgi:hypothetical protein
MESPLAGGRESEVGGGYRASKPTLLVSGFSVKAQPTIEKSNFSGVR